VCHKPAKSSIIRDFFKITLCIVQGMSLATSKMGGCLMPLNISSGGINMCAWLLLLGVLLGPLLGCVADIDAEVVSIADGDTLTILHNRERVKVRLAEIDAPEKDQPFGQRSRQSLADLCFEQPVRIQAKGQDQYGRTLARVWCGDVDANAEQVQRGMAWVYDQYNTNKQLYALQEDAQKVQRGLWADSNPTPPWKWRARHRNR
jgi:micrococcal nuclease